VFEIAHYLLVELAWLFEGLDLVNKGVAQGLQGFDPLVGNARCSIFFRFTAHMGLGQGYMKRSREGI
jgi:hypothetical protein